MKRASNRPPADEFNLVRERWVVAGAEHDQAAAAVEQAKAACEERLGQLAQDLALDKTTVDDYERAKAENERPLTEAESALTRSEAVLAALAARAFELAQQIAEKKQAEIREALTRVQEDNAALEAKLTAGRVLEAELDGQLEDAARESAEAGAEFDATRRAEAWTREQQERELAQWWAAQPSWRVEAESLSPPMRRRIEEEREKRRVKAEAERAGFRERSRRQWEQLGAPAAEHDLPDVSPGRTFDRVA